MTYTIGQVAKFARISIRALHHYDAIGLVTPSARSEAGYRLYDTADLERLQQVLMYRELGFGLSRIRDLLSDPKLDRRAALVAQRKSVAARRRELAAMLELIDRTLASIEEERSMKPEEIFDVFGSFDPKQYEDEAQERWGDTEAYRESRRRTSRYRREDWEKIRDAQEDHMARLVVAFDEGLRPESREGMELAEEARQAIDRAFYPCSLEMHAALSELYVNDPRFRSFYDDRRPGLAAWFAAAIRANAER
jgi:DNA-binding transcriptional MerR regulator